MSCDKCENIHAAQLTGFSSEPCKCDCHNKQSNFIVDYTTTTSDGEIESFTTCSVGGCETLRL
jgi:hypothetical protein